MSFRAPRAAVGAASVMDEFCSSKSDRGFVVEADTLMENIQ